ncbi:hypothetical protein ACWF95_41975, partial [Streptomyces vinaceus]
MSIAITARQVGDSAPFETVLERDSMPHVGQGPGTCPPPSREADKISQADKYQAATALRCARADLGLGELVRAPAKSFCRPVTWGFVGLAWCAGVFRSGWMG